MRFSIVKTASGYAVEDGQQKVMRCICNTKAFAERLLQIKIEQHGG